MVFANGKTTKCIHVIPKKLDLTSCNHINLNDDKSHQNLDVGIEKKKSDI